MKNQSFSDLSESYDSHDHHHHGNNSDNHRSASRLPTKRKGIGDWSEEEIRRLIISIINNRSILRSRSTSALDDLSNGKISKGVSIQGFIYA